jgi:aminoglycoside phosphotransferase family enzyme
LHTEHIIIDGDKIYIFDCIEFNERFRFIDVACDFAFFLMDLDFLGRSDLSHYAQELYVLETGDEEALKLFPLFKSYRAYVRGKVNSFMFSDPNIKDKDAVKKTASQYFRLAKSYLESEF